MQLSQRCFAAKKDLHLSPAPIRQCVQACAVNATPHACTVPAADNAPCKSELPKTAFRRARFPLFTGTGYAQVEYVWI